MRMWARVWLDSASVTAAKQGLDTTNKHFRKHDRGPFVRSWDDQALIGNGEAPRRTLLLTILWNVFLYTP